MSHFNQKNKHRIKIIHSNIIQIKFVVLNFFIYVKYWFTANGLSYGRALDDQSDYIHKTKKTINKSKSRRVEFRLITAGEEMLEEFVEKTK